MSNTRLIPKTPTKQRSELTFKFNGSLGRHGWLRLTPAYSVKIVESIISNKNKPLRVLDPFSGTGTTPLSAAMHGCDAVAVDINPFLVWFGKTKVCNYDIKALQGTEHAAVEIVNSINVPGIEPASAPAIFNIHRWWPEPELGFLCTVKGVLDKVAYERGPVRDLLLIAFCRTMIDLSNAAFNHQSMSFKTPAENQQRSLNSTTELGLTRFRDNVEFTLRGAALNPEGIAEVRLLDARYVCDLDAEPFDLVITSPPYPNRMSYIRELRPYMYWLGYLTEAREAGELDWKAIGGTWGVATSRVNQWRKDESAYFPSYLDEILNRIRLSDGKSGEVLANYVGKYFEDMWLHINSVLKVVKLGGELHYIVGNSKFYDVVVPTESIYRDMLLEAGAVKTTVVPLRKRNSKKELIEFDVIAER